MGRFIAEHGLVQYHSRLDYQRDGLCEIAGCADLRAGFASKPGSRRGWNVSESRDSPLHFDHCHAHGWIRGLVCASCNSVTRHLDRHGYLLRYRAPLREAYRRHLNQCPDCEQIDVLATDYEINYAYGLTLPDSGFKSATVKYHTKSMRAAAEEHGMTLDDFIVRIRYRYPEPRTIGAFKVSRGRVSG
jgi:hypothetical protein